MKPDKIDNNIDNKIIEHLSTGKSLIDVYYLLQDNIEKFSKREDFLDVNENFIKSNWDSINFKKRYTTYYVIQAKKRKAEIMWLIMNSENRFYGVGDLKLFKLLKFKEMLMPKMTNIM
jgi:hypothetical protein